MGDRYGCPERSDGGISHNPGTPSGADKPPHPPKADPDSGPRNTSTQLPPQCTKAHCDQFREMRNQTSGRGRCERLTNESQDSEDDLRLELVNSISRVVRAFHRCKKSPMVHDFAQSCAELLAIAVPENILPVFAQAYQERVGRGEQGKTSLLRPKEMREKVSDLPHY